MNKGKFVTLLPQEFYPIFLNELINIFGQKIIGKDEKYNFYGYDCENGTAGWYDAFKRACEKINQIELYELYNQFDCIDSDLIDKFICVYLDTIMEKSKDGKTFK